MSEKRVVEIPSFKLRDQTWEEFILDDKDMNGILDDDVLTILSVSLPQLIASTHCLSCSTSFNSFLSVSKLHVEMSMF